MLELGFLLITILSISFISIRLRNIAPLSLEAIFYIFYIVYAVLGALALLLRLDEKRLNDVVIDEGVLYFLWFISITSIISISLLVKLLKDRTFLDFVTIKVQGGERYDERLVLILSLFFIFITFLQFSMSDAPLAIVLSGGDVQEAFIARQTKQDAFGFFKLYHFNFLTKEALFFWCCFLFVYFIKYKKQGMLLTLCTLSLLVSFYSNLSKAGGVFLLAAFGILFLALKRKKLSFPVVFLGILIVVFVAVIPQYFFIPSGQEFDFFRLSKAVLSRIISGQIEPAYYVVSYIDGNDYLYGATFPNPKGILPFEHFDLETKTWELMNPTRLSMGLTYRNPTVFWVDGYANFGLIGIIIYVLIVAAIIYFVDVWFFRKRAINCLDAGLLCYLSFHYARLSGKSLSTFFWDLDLLVVIIFYFFSIKYLKKKEIQ